jgi:hypothetical protein
MNAVAAAGGSVRPKNHGRLLPGWVDTSDPEAIRGSYQIRRIDANLVVALNRRSQVYEVWGPSITAGGWVPICECRDDEWRPYRGSVPWPLIVQALLNAREGEPACEVAARRNEERAARDERQRGDELREALRYAHRAVNLECRGASPYPVRDVVEGYMNARDGRAKMRATGRVIVDLATSSGERV